MNLKDVEVVLKLLLESVPFQRSRLFKLLIKSGGRLRSDQVQAFLSHSRQSALSEMRTLALLGLVNESKEEEEHKGKPVIFSVINLTEELRWLLKARVKWPHLFEV